MSADGTTSDWLTPQDPIEFNFAEIAVSPRLARVYAYRVDFHYSGLDGQGIMPFAPQEFVNDIVVDTAGTLYGAHSNSIFRIDHGLITPITAVLNSGVNYNLAVDNANEQLFWTRGENTSASIYRADLDGSNLQAVVQMPDTGGGPTEIEINPDGTRLYWTTGVQGEIWSSDPDGSDQTLLVSGLRWPAQGLTYNPLDDRLYWLSALDSQMFRVNSDGTGMELFADLGAFGLSVPQDLTLYIAPAPSGLGVALLALLLPGARSRRDRQVPESQH